MAVEFSELIPAEVKDRLFPRFQSTEDIHNILNTLQEDFPHRRGHLVEMEFNLWWAWESVPVTENWSSDYDIALRAIRLHDKGYIFVEQGILKPEEHQFGSLAIASVVDSDPRVLYTILHHTDDVLPESAPTYCRVVRDLDRLCGLGFSGANRLAYYIDGFRERFKDLLSQEEEFLLRSGIFFECGYPMEEEYESQSQTFYNKKLMQFIGEDITGERKNRMVEQLLSSMVRIYGSKEYKVDPIFSGIEWMFRPKILHTLQAQEVLVAREFKIGA